MKKNGSPNMLVTHEHALLIHEALEGSCKTTDAVLEQLELDVEAYQDDDVIFKMLDLNLECCSGCGWWMESCELVPDEQEEGDDDALVGLCLQCRKEKVDHDWK